MGLFDKKIGTIFLKEDSDAESFVLQMTELLDQVNDEQLKRACKNAYK